MKILIIIKCGSTNPARRSSYKLSSEAKERLGAMCGTNDGFEISEIDLRLRGPGDIAGTKQSGLLDLKIANIVKDEPILKAARNTAIEIAQQDPMLITPQNQKLKEYFQRTKPQIDFSQMS